MHDEVLQAAEELRDRLAWMASEWLTWPRLRQELVNQGAPDPVTLDPVGMDVRRAVERLLDPARPALERERTAVALRLALASHPDMGLIWLGGAALPAAQGGAMQAMLAARDDVFARWHEFQLGMQRVGVTMCQIHVKQRFTGSGFLIADRYVLTACHCVEELIEDGEQRPYQPADLLVVFDDLVVPGQTRSSYRTEIMADSHWLVACSPPDSGERSARAPLDTLQPQCLDFAVIRLAEAAGNMAPKHLPSMKRQWIGLADLADTPQRQAQMLIAHYPGGADLRLAVGLFGDHAADARRVRYYTPTIVGSSGAPCFSVDWRPYALHNAGYQECNTNQGVPLSLIWHALDGGRRLVSAAPGLHAVPPVDTAGMPILGRTALLATVAAVLDGRSDARIFTATGARLGGKTYTAQLIRTFLLDRGCQVFLLNAGHFGADTPEQFARRLITEIGGSAFAAAPPEAPDSRQRARWISRRLAEWARKELEWAPRATPGTHAAAPAGSAWIILDGCQPDLLSPETNDLLAALLGELAENAGSLRIMLTGYDGNLLGLPQERIHHTDLDLMSPEACVPYMAHVLSLRDAALEAEQLHDMAAQFADSAADYDVNTVAAFGAALKRWWERWCARNLSLSPTALEPAEPLA